jgi:hypothetical protein
LFGVLYDPCLAILDPGSISQQKKNSRTASLPLHSDDEACEIRGSQQLDTFKILALRIYYTVYMVSMRIYLHTLRYSRADQSWSPLSEKSASTMLIGIDEGLDEQIHITWNNRRPKSHARIVASSARPGLAHAETLLGFSPKDCSTSDTTRASIRDPPGRGQPVSMRVSQPPAPP